MSRRKPLFERGVIRGLEFPVKILGSGEVDGKLNVSVARRFEECARGGSRPSRWHNHAFSSEPIAGSRHDRAVAGSDINSELKDAGFGKVGGPQRAKTLPAERRGGAFDA